jgi:hypothetical protein
MLFRPIWSNQAIAVTRRRLRGLGLTLLVGFAGDGCSRAKDPDSILLNMVLPAGMWQNVVRSIGHVEVWLDEGGTASLFPAPKELAQATTPEGIPYQYQVADVDGDGR